jgi:hypothetical protein
MKKPADQFPSWLKDLAFTGMIHSIGEKIDREAIHQGWQESWLAGALTGELALDAGRRIAAKNARLEHVRRALAWGEQRVKDGDLDRAVYERRVREFHLLQPYLETGLNVPEAALAYRRDREGRPGKGS